MSTFFNKDMQSCEVIASVLSQEAQQYAPLPLRSVMVGKPVSFDLFLKTIAKGSSEPKIIRCCAPGDKFQEDWRRKLEKLQIQWLYFSLEDVDRVFAYLQGHLESFLKDESHSELEKAQHVCDSTQVWILHFFTAEKNRTGKQIALALSLVDDLLGAVKNTSYNSLLLLELRKHDFFIYTHSVNCCILGLAFANYLGWPPDKARNFGLGALIHDIGYARLPRELFAKEEGPDEDDLVKIQRHTIEGFRMLQSFAHIPWEALQMVLRHHENGDGSGYPEGLKLSAIPTWARIMRIIDSYEELTAERPWHRPLPPKEALWTMRQHWEKSKVYDYHYLKAFISFLAGYSPGAAKGA
ncbi:MAG: HD domain-containing phosphohydrolase [Thermodesulfobacteriota bacterium]